MTDKNEKPNIQDTIKNAITEQLPQMHAGILGNELERLQKIERDFTAMREDFRLASEEHEALKQEMIDKDCKFSDLAQRENFIEKQESDLKDRTDKLYINEQLILMRENHCGDRVNDAKETLGLVFRNSRTQQNIHSSGIVPNGSTSTPPVLDQNGNVSQYSEHQSHTAQQSVNTTIDTEEK